MKKYFGWLKAGAIGFMVQTKNDIFSYILCSYIQLVFICSCSLSLPKHCDECAEYLIRQNLCEAVIL